MIRNAVPDDGEAIAALATVHDLHGYDSVQNPAYRDLLHRHGRLVVAVERGDVVGFGGMVNVAGAAMVTDLFVRPDLYGRGHGTAVVAALLAHHERRMTFSSRDERARAAYRRAGLRPQWFLRYLRGPGGGDTGPLVATPATTADVGSDRPDLVGFFAGQPGTRFLHLRAGSDRCGHAIVTDAGSHLAVDRLVADGPHDHAVAALLAALPADRDVELCVPEPSPAMAYLRRRGFTEVEYDLHMASEPGLLAPGLVAANAGLA